jgi:hypothetical protein
VNYLQGTLWITGEGIGSFLLQTFNDDPKTCFFIFINDWNIGVLEYWSIEIWGCYA